jgi:hypothetical protein
MTIESMIKDLSSRRDEVDQAIMSLELLAAGRAKRRGRPPLWMKALDVARTDKKFEERPSPS